MCSLAQDECNGSREDVVEAMLVVMREEEMLKTRYMYLLRIDKIQVCPHLYFMMSPFFRFPIILIQELFLLGRWDEMDEWLRKAQNNASTHFLLHLLKVGYKIYD